MRAIIALTIVAGAIGSSSDTSILPSLASRTWSQQENVLVASDAKEFDHYGNTLAVDGDRVFIGSKSFGNVDNKVYVSEYNDVQRGNSTSVAIDNTKSPWSELKIRSLKPIPSFANSIAASNGYVFVGAPLDTPSKHLENSGSVTVYKLDPKPVIVQTIKSDKIKANFGSSISANLNSLVIGASEEHGGEGRAYLFQKTNDM